MLSNRHIRSQRPDTLARAHRRRGAEMTRAMLHTERLTLRRATPDDLDALWSLWRDTEVRRGPKGDERAKRDQHAATPSDLLVGQRFGLWLLVPRGQHVAVGCVGWMRRDIPAPLASTQPNPSIETLVALQPAFWGHGYAQEALAALAADGTLGLPPGSGREAGSEGTWLETA